MFSGVPFWSFAASRPSLHANAHPQLRLAHAAADRPPQLATDRGTNGRATLIYIDKNFVTCPPTHTHTVHHGDDTP